MDQVDFENLLKRTMGLDATSVGSGAIERAVRTRMATHKLEQPADYWQRLQDTDDELQELIEAVVVPETWFFRDPKAFSALARFATEEWRPTHPNSLLRLLSIPCSTGEESYSMVMALLQAGLTPKEFQVDAVDISAQALVRAKRGAYGINSFRSQDLGFRDRYFRPTMHGYNLVEQVCNQVRFRQGNLLSDEFCFSQESYDVVFCRNLLIYFDRPTQALAMKTLERLLTASGFLFVGPAEAFLASLSGFTSVNEAMSFAFRKIRKQVPETPRTIRPVQLKPANRPLIAPIQRPVKLNLLASTTQKPDAPPTKDLEVARRLADAGRMQEAALCCEKHLQHKGPTAEAYYLLGLVRDALGNRKSAAEYYRKVLYLEPDHLQALLHLALLIGAEGDMASAERLRDRARRVEARSKNGES